MIRKILLLIFVGTILPKLYAQVPHLSGNIDVSINSGSIDAEFLLSNLPESDNYAILLNSGLNIEYFRDSEDRFNYSFNKEYLPEISYEAFHYYFPSNDNNSRYLPSSFNLSYTGKFPVISDTSKAGDWDDWKGNIAFNGQTVRASEQSAWYPILYDRENEIIIDRYTFEITVECNDCRTLYVNGELPQTSSKEVFLSNEPVPLLLFLGNYDFIKNNKTYILNSTINPEKQKTLSQTTDEIVEFYEEKLNIPYGKPVVYLSTTPVSKRNEWMFVSYPTVAVVGIDAYKLENYFDEKTYEFKQKSNITFIAHELAHYYIGTIFIPNSTLRWVFLEGLTDYLSIQAARELLGDTIYLQILKNYSSEVESFEPSELANVKLASEINETYRYRYVPLLFTAIEKEVGEEKMWAWVRAIINSDATHTDFEFFKSTLTEAGVPENTLNHILETYIYSPSSKQNVLEQLK